LQLVFSFVYYVLKKQIAKVDEILEYSKRTVKNMKQICAGINLPLSDFEHEPSMLSK